MVERQQAGRRVSADRPVGGTDRPESESDRPRARPERIPPPGSERPSTLWRRLYTIHLPLVLVGVGLLAAVVFIIADRWRRGTIVFGLVTLGAAVFRLLLPEERVGLLAVRSRAFDVGFLTVLGGLVIWLAGSIDPLGTG